MRVVRARLELRMCLRGDEPRVILDLDHLDEAVIRQRAGDDQSLLLQGAAELIVELEAVAMALMDEVRAICLFSMRAIGERAGI